MYLKLILLVSVNEYFHISFFIPRQKKYLNIKSLIEAVLMLGAGDYWFFKHLYSLPGFREFLMMSDIMFDWYWFAYLDCVFFFSTDLFKFYHSNDIKCRVKYLLCNLRFQFQYDVKFNYIQIILFLCMRILWL